MAQFVTLQGKQFKDGNGNDFYPLVCNYNCDIAYNAGASPTDTSAYYVSPEHSYGEGYGGSPIDFENDNQTDCLVQIQKDFLKIKNMGFNTIRLNHIAPQKFAAPNSIGYYIPAVQNLHPLWGAPVTNLQLSSPFISDPVTNMLFNRIDRVIQEAKIAGLKVILDNTNTGYISLSQSAINEWDEYLKAMANHFKANTTIMAYVIIEEPMTGGNYAGRPKQEICEIMKLWYDDCKKFDRNHLITMGGQPPIDLLEWDPGVMKMDFYSAHIYPLSQAYGTNHLTDQYNRFWGNVYWLGNNSPFPWIIGETGFSAIDDPLFITNSLPPDGTLTEQATYAHNTLNVVRDCYGSGYSWWQYQEFYWGNEWDDGLGILRHGDVASSSVDKPLVSEFTAYFTNGQPPAPQSCTPPPNYYDPFNCADYNTAHTNAVSGVIYDQNGNPTKDAFIRGLNWLSTDYSDPNLLLYFHSTIYTFSKTDGSYELIPYNYVTIGDNRLVYVSGSALGSEKFEFPHNPVWPYDDTQMQTTVPPVTLAGNNLATGQFVAVGNTQNFTGLVSLTISNTTIDGNGTTGGTSDITARKEIYVQSEFNARTGSEVHIYLSEAFAECSDLGGYVLKNFTKPLDGASQQEETKEIELRFLQVLDVSIMPNPTTGIFTLKRYTSVEIKPATLIIRNFMGQTMKQLTLTENETLIDASSYSKGVYFLELSTDKKITTQKLIIN